MHQINNSSLKMFSYRSILRIHLLFRKSNEVLMQYTWLHLLYEGNLIPVKHIPTLLLMSQLSLIKMQFFLEHLSFEYYHLSLHFFLFWLKYQINHATFGKPFLDVNKNCSRYQKFHSLEHTNLNVNFHIQAVIIRIQLQKHQYFWEH